MDINIIKNRWLHDEPLNYYEVLRLMEDDDFQVYLKMNDYIILPRDSNGDVMNTAEYPHQVSLKSTL